MKEVRNISLARLFGAIGFLALVLPTSSFADDTYRLHPGESYLPSTYCNWNRSGLPSEYQQVCADRDKKYGVYKPEWRKLEADNGAVFLIDVHSIMHYNNGAASIVVYAAEGSSFNPQNEASYTFDCRGHFQTDQAPDVTEYAPPHSVVGQISSLVCTSSKPQPSEHCTGFNQQACDRIEAVVRSGVRPDYCRAGYGVVGAGLSTEQIRICELVGINN